MIHFFQVTNTFINVLIVSPCMLGLFHQKNNCFAVSDTTYMVKRVVIHKVFTISVYPTDQLTIEMS